MSYKNLSDFKVNYQCTTSPVMEFPHPFMKTPFGVTVCKFLPNKNYLFLYHMIHVSFSFTVPLHIVTFTCANYSGNPLPQFNLKSDRLVKVQQD